MKFSKVINGTPVTRPMSARLVLTAIKATVATNVTDEVLTGIFADNGWLPVPPTTQPAIPSELLGRCVVSLGIPTVGSDGSLQRTYEFTEATAAQLDAAQRGNRAKRDRLLAQNVDSVNAVRWSTMTVEKQTEWTAYRQALLDLPDQPGFPMNVSWPVKPT